MKEHESIQSVYIPTGYPSEAEFKQLLDNPEKFKLTYISYTDVQFIGLFYPKHVTKFIELLLSDRDYFNQICDSSSNAFIIMMSQLGYRAIAEDVFGKLFDDPEKFQAIFKSFFELWQFAGCLPDLALKLFRNLVKKPEEYNRLFPSCTEATMAIKRGGKLSGVVYFETFCNPDNYQRLFQSHSLLTDYTSQQITLPNDLLNTKTAEEALECVKQRQIEAKELQKNARVLGLFRQTEKTALKQLPAEISKEIVTYITSLTSIEVDEIFDREYTLALNKN